MIRPHKILIRWSAISVSILIAMLSVIVCEVTAVSQYDISLSSYIIPQGDMSLIRVKVKNGGIPRVTWMQREIYLVPNNKKTEYYGFLVADLTARPGHYKALVELVPTGRKKKLEIEVTEKDYGIRRLTLPKNMVDLDAETLKRAKKESKIMRRLWDALPSTPYWRGPFERPIPGEVVGPFGRKSIINNQPRAPHSGVDLRAQKGTPIKAINHGIAAFTGDHFFTGQTVVMDHGGGIQSMYFHLEKILVQQGKMIEKGQVIGLVGSTGRATGPHLHWGIRINGARVNPLKLIILSREMEE
ncbi:MAG: M23 family metallopeptidase [Deltaproteobacteria bacterium]|nr:M23 family metallopeptidase [Deltaproteobacteria bacterium]